MKEWIFKKALSALMSFGRHLTKEGVSLVLDFFCRFVQTKAAPLAAEFALEAIDLVRAAGNLNPVSLGFPDGRPVDKRALGNARREWVYNQLRALAVKTGREIPSHILDSAIQDALLYLRAQ